MHVGVAGLGNMGTAIAARLIETGNKVTVWNRTAAKRAPLAAAEEKVAASPAAQLFGPLPRDCTNQRQDVPVNTGAPRYPASLAASSATRESHGSHHNLTPMSRAMIPATM